MMFTDLETKKCAGILLEQLYMQDGMQMLNTSTVQ